MCTAITYYPSGHYFGRNLDLEQSFCEEVTIVPRNFPMRFRCAERLKSHYAIIGMAIIEEDYPLYYDATNEKGLSIAGLNFPGNAVYFPFRQEAVNITPYELTPWILGQCATLNEAERLLESINLLNIPFNEKYPLTPLHWLIADQNRSITVESTKKGLMVYKNPIGVLTNNPPFEYHICNLTNYMNLSSKAPENRFSDQINLTPYSRGMGAMGLPGDLSSASRFVRATFTKLNSRCDSTRHAEISQFFHILGSVTQQNGCTQVKHGYEKTIYSSCCDLDKGIYYYKTYNNSQITGVAMHNADLEASRLFHYPLRTQQSIFMENGS